MAQFYKTVLVPIAESEVLKTVYPEWLANQLTLEGRLPKCECEDCKGTDWIIRPKESVAVKESGKPYIECMNCGYVTHL